MEVRVNQAKVSMEQKQLQLKKRREFVESTIVPVHAMEFEYIAGTVGLGQRCAAHRVLVLQQSPHWMQLARVKSSHTYTPVMWWC